MPEPVDENSQNSVQSLTATIGKWQILLITFTCTVMAMLASNDVAMVFYAPEQDFHCVSSHDTCYINVDLTAGSNLESQFNETNQSVEKPGQYSMEKCSHWEYDKSSWKRTIVEEWDLVCDRDVVLQFMTYVYFAATISGYVLFGHLSDVYGRRKMVIICMLSMICAGFVLAFSINYLMFAIVRFFIGFFLTGTEPNCFVWMMESLDSKGRDVCGMMAMVSWSLGLLFLTGVAYLLRDWTYIQVSVTIPSLFAFFIVIYSMESPRWLMSVGKHRECIKVLTIAADMNNKTLPDEETLNEEIKSVKHSQYETKCKFMDLFKKAALRRSTLILLYIGFTINFLNFPMIMMSESVQTEIFMYMAATSSLEIVGVLIAAFEIRKFGRKCPIVCNITIGGILCFAIMVIPEYKVLFRMGVAILGRTFVATAGSQLIIFSVELFPTTIRALGFGILSMVSRLGAICAELIISIDYVTFPWASIALKLFLCLIAGLLALMLPETSDKDLPSTVDDTLDRFPLNRRRMRICCCCQLENPGQQQDHQIPETPIVTTV